MSEIWSAAIGIVGTILGTVLGWLLNNISNRGKLNVYISLWTDMFEHYDDCGYLVRSFSKEQTEHYSYKLIIDLYNSSAEPKIMRNIKVVFSNGVKLLKTSTPYDDSTKQVGNNFTSVHFDKIIPLNIIPKSVLTINLHDEWNDNGSLNFIWETDSIYLQYTDENNKEKTIPIKKGDYKNPFDSEGKKNGYLET